MAEYDSVVATGEQVTVGLLALTLRGMGIPARSFLSWQLPIRTDAQYMGARIENISTELLHAALDKGEVVIVPGFQGITDDNRMTTLGRGGSDPCRPSPSPNPAPRQVTRFSGCTPRPRPLDSPRGRRS